MECYADRVLYIQVPPVAVHTYVRIYIHTYIHTYIKEREKRGGGEKRR